MKHILSLRELLATIKAMPDYGNDGAAIVTYCHAVGLPVKNGECDFTSLPTFGGNARSLGSWPSRVMTMSVGIAKRLIARDAYAADVLAQRPGYDAIQFWCGFEDGRQDLYPNVGKRT